VLSTYKEDWIWWNDEMGLLDVTTPSK